MVPLQNVVTVSPFVDVKGIASVNRTAASTRGREFVGDHESLLGLGRGMTAQTGGGQADGTQ